jgi:metal-responsive CopG/Arc/MetJ family transcriptional regulator
MGKMKKRINITLEEKLIKRFQDYCKKRGMKVSTKIELLIAKELKR